MTRSEGMQFHKTWERISAKMAARYLKDREYKNAEESARSAHYHREMARTYKEFVED